MAAQLSGCGGNPDKELGGARGPPHWEWKDQGPERATEVVKPEGARLGRGCIRWKGQPGAMQMAGGQ